MANGENVLSGSGGLRSLNEYYSAMPWEWYQLKKADAKDVVLARSMDFLVIDTLLRTGHPSEATTLLMVASSELGLTPKTIARLLADNVYGIVIESDNHPNAESVDSVIRYARVYGAFEQALYLIHEFRSSYGLLFDRYDLSVDGAVDIGDDSVSELHYAVASRFNDIVFSGKRCVDRMEELLKTVLGKNSDGYESWKKFDKQVYDDDLLYAFCYDTRNAIEHGFMIISVVNVNAKSKKAGLAINLDAGVLDEGLRGNDGIQKKSLRTRLYHFRNERIERGETPWLSVAGTLRNWKGEIELLYINFLGALFDCLDELSGEASVFEHLDALDCLVWHCAGGGHNDRDEFSYVKDRIYALPPRNWMSQLKGEALSSVRSIPEGMVSQKDVEPLVAEIRRWGCDDTDK